MIANISVSYVFVLFALASLQSVDSAVPVALKSKDELETQHVKQSIIDGTVVKSSAFSTTNTKASPTCSSCSGSYEDFSGVISSPNYPSNYCDGLDCWYTIRVPSEFSRIRLYFTAFNTEPGCDFVQVYDGTTINNTTLLNYAGTSIPSNDIYSSGNQMLVRFITDGSVTRSGWQATYEVFP